MSLGAGVGGNPIFEDFKLKVIFFRLYPFGLDHYNDNNNTFKTSLNYLTSNKREKKQ